MKNIFVSSTFKDMQEERNLIHTQIMPKVNHILKEKGAYANFLDFRWGINTESLEEEAAMEKVLTACFNAINDCNHMIVFIGDNYGTCVPPHILENIKKSNNFICNVSEKSVTELEIEYTFACKTIPPENIVFYFKRNYNNQDNKVLALKKKIEKRYPDRIRKYRSVDDNLAEQIVNDVLTWFEETDNLSYSLTERIMTDHLSRFSCRENLLYETSNNVLENSFTIVYGESGCGKSVFMSALKNHLSCKCHAEIIYAKKTFYNAHYVLEKLWDFIECTVCNYYPKYNLNNDFWGGDYEKQINAVFSLINNDSEIKDFVFLIDGIDKFNSTQITEILNVLRNYSHKLHIVISLDDPNKYLYLQKPCYIYLSRLSDKDKISVINKELKAYHKTLPEKAIKTLINKKDSGLPLYLILVIKRLIKMQKSDYTEIYRDLRNTNTAINEHITNIINSFSDDIENMIIDYIEFSEKIINEEYAMHIVSFLAISAFGFTDEELYFLIRKYSQSLMPVIGSETFRDSRPLIYLGGNCGINNFSEVEFYLFCRYMGDLINTNFYNGKILFENTIVKQSIYKLYHGNIFLDSISNEMYYNPEDRLLSDYEICNNVLRTTILKGWVFNPYSNIVIRRPLYPPFYLINKFMLKAEKKQLELLASALFDLLSNDGVRLLNNYLDKANRYNKSIRGDKEEALNSIRFIIKYLFPKVENSMLNPIDFVPVFENCLTYLRKFMDYSSIDNRLYLIMARFNISIMCYNSNNIDEAIRIARACEAQLKTVPKKLRNSLYYDAVKTYKDIVNKWYI